MLEIPDPPTACFIKGKLPEQKQPVIGARECSRAECFVVKRPGTILVVRNTGHQRNETCRRFLLQLNLYPGKETFRAICFVPV